MYIAYYVYYDDIRYRVDWGWHETREWCRDM